MLVRELTVPTLNQLDGDGETDENLQFLNVLVMHNRTLDRSEKGFRNVIGYYWAGYAG